MTSFKNVLGVLLIAGVTLTSCDNAKDTSSITEASMMSEMDSISYAYGVMSGDGVFKQGVSIDADLFSAGFRKGIEGEDALINIKDSETLLRAYFTKLQQQDELKALGLAEENKKVGELFLAENGKRAGVITTESGLQYEVIVAGNGKSPTSADRVQVHYTGTLTDGTVFDSSVEKGQPATFGVTQVIPGWTEALQLMKEGAQIKAYIPSNLGYGDMDRDPIPPGSTLIFEMELLKVM
ncbi:MAG: FKBP-type peptidyl-prolyl cis-trans isomerase FklB [Patiriisocius sp.]|jgi:FKBP-type peptidyl-prolyl cis-trans isomerase FklB